MKTVIGFFEGDVAKRVVGELTAEGFTSIQQRTKAKLGTLKDLTDVGVPNAEARLYMEELAEGGTLLMVETKDEAAPIAIEIMKRGGARDFRAHLARLEEGGLIPIIEEQLVISKQEIDLGSIRVHARVVTIPVEKEVVLLEEHVNVDRRRVERPATDRDFAEREIAMVEHAEEAFATKTAHVVEEIKLGRTVTEHTEKIRDSLRHTEIEAHELAAKPPPLIAEVAIPEGEASRDTIPVVDEVLQVGKRQYERGGRAIRSHIVATPVEKDVALRDERVNVGRLRVERPATKADFEAPDLEMVERTERPFTAKTANVVEEIRLNRSAEEHKEKIKGSVRHTEIDIVDHRAMRKWDEYSKEYRAHFDRTFATAGGKWEAYEPAYRLGHVCGNDGRDWTIIEVEARDRWEKANPGTWDRVKDAVRAAFDRARGVTSPAMKRPA